MTHNVGTIDRTVRVLLAVGLLSLFFLLEGAARWVGLVGVIPLLTAAVGYCPVYQLVGLSTCPAPGRGRA